LHSKEALLFEKRSKNFGPLARALNQPNALQEKVFSFFFFKKEPLSFALVLTQPRHGSPTIR
jgi:hypothetical protein